MTYNNSYGPGGDPELRHYVAGTSPDHDITTTSEYDAAGNVVRTTDPLGSITLTGYDALNRPVRTIRNASQPTYNLAADPTLSNYKPSGLAGQDLVASNVYDALGRVIASQDPLGSTTLYGYDGLGRQIKTVSGASQPTYNIAADPALSRYVGSGLPDQDVITTSAYDAQGRTAYTTDALGHTTWFVYDGQGRVIRTIANAVGTATDGSAYDPRSSAYALSPDPDKDIVTTTAYDANGYVMYTTDVLGHHTWYAYDSVGRTVKTIQNAVGTATDGGPNDPRSPAYVPSSDPDKDMITTTAYDPQGRVMTATDALGRATWYAYDSLGRTVRTVVNASGTATDGGPGDPRSAAYISSGAPDQDLVTTTTYDPVGRVMYTTDVLGRRTWFAYDSLGRTVKTIQNAGGNATDGGPNDPRSSQYTPAPAGDQDLIATTVYDVAGRVVSTTDPLGQATWYAYDGLSRVVQTIVNAVGTATDGSIRDPRAPNYAVSSQADQDLVSLTTYDSLGRVLWTQDPVGRRTWYVYDSLGRAIRTIQNASGTATDGSVADPRHPNAVLSANGDQDIVTQTVYNAAGQVTATIDALGNVTRYQYDGLGRRVQTIVNFVTGAFNPAWPDQDLVSAVTYDKAGRVLVSVDPRGVQTTFGYDNLGRRVSVTMAANTPQASTTYTCYDKAGQVLRAIQNFQPAPTDPAPDARDAGGSFTFNPTWHGLGADLNLVTSYTLDRLGRQIAVIDPLGNTIQMTYDLDGQLQSTTDPLGVVTQYRYDAARRRTLVVADYTANGQDPVRWVWNSVTACWEQGS